MGGKTSNFEYYRKRFKLPSATEFGIVKAMFAAMPVESCGDCPNVARCAHKPGHGSRGCIGRWFEWLDEPCDSKLLSRPF